MSLIDRFRRGAPPPAAKGQTVATANTRTGWDVFGVPSDSGDGFAYNLDHALLAANGHISSERAILQLSTAMACVRLLASTIATLPIAIYRRLPNGEREAAREHPLYTLLHNQPNARMTAVDYWQMQVAWMLLRGTAYTELDMIGGRLVALDPLEPKCLTWRKLDGGARLYTYRDPKTGKSRDIPEDRIWKLPAFTLDGSEGLSAIKYGAGVFGNASAADEASSNLFSNGLSASGFVKTADNVWLTKEKRDLLRSHLREFGYQAKHSREVFVLEGGMEYKPLAMNPDDAQMLETRAFNIEEICRWFGVPPTLVGHGDKTSNWGTGLEQQNLSFLTYSLRPWLTKIEQSIWKYLIPAAEKAKVYAEFSVEALLRADSAGRASFYSSGLQNGWINRNAVARMENLPAPPGGDLYTVQANLVPLDSLPELAAARMPKQPAAINATAASEVTAAEDVQATALNGAQVNSLQSLLEAAAAGTMPLATVRAAIAAAFPLLTPADIDAMIGPLLDFTPAAPAPEPQAGP